jgi:ankyrin repeat protein
MRRILVKNCIYAPTIVIFFCAIGCQMPYADRPELSPLGNAARHQDVTRLNQLLANGAEVNTHEKQSETALYDALECAQPNCDNVPTIDALLDHGAAANTNLPWWGTPLTFSLTRQYGNPKASVELIRRGSVVSKTCNGGDTDLSLATQNVELEVMRALLENGADPNCANERGATALYWAAINGEAPAVELLLRFGANPNEVSRDGLSILDIAQTTNPDRSVQKKFQKTRAILTKYGAGGTHAIR